jgi:hypothetical protein
MMGARGPVPKRAEQRRRTNKPTTEIKTAAASPEVTTPTADDAWHPVARRWFDSLAESGQAVWYEPSDWALAYLLAESMTRDLEAQFVGFEQTSRETTEAKFAKIPLKGASLAAYLKAMSNLLVTEGDRRRAGVELQRGETVEKPSNVIDYRARAAARA